MKLFKGSIGRAKYAGGMFLSIAITGLITSVVFATVDTFYPNTTISLAPDKNALAAITAWIIIVATLISYFVSVFSLTTKRLNDLNASKALLLLMIIPTLNLLLVVCLFFIPSKKPDNQVVNS